METKIATGAGHRRNSGNDNNQRRLKRERIRRYEATACSGPDKACGARKSCRRRERCGPCEVLRMIVESTRVFREINSRDGQQWRGWNPEPCHHDAGHAAVGTGANELEAGNRGLHRGVLSGAGTGPLVCAVGATGGCTGSNATTPKRGLNSRVSSEKSCL